jgi:hypothetical protein
LALKSANESVIQATAFRDLVVATTTASAARDREFMQGVLAQQSQAAAQQAQTAAQNASQQQAFLLQAFTQQMAQQQAAHTQMLEALGVMRRNDGDAEGSAERLMAIFMQGMQMGRGMELGEEQPFWQEILKGGMGLLGSVREKQLAGTANPALPAPAKGKSSPPKLNRLLKAMRSRGIDTDRLIDMLERGAPSPTSESEDGPEEPESDSDSEDVEPQGPIFTSS